MQISYDSTCFSMDLVTVMAAGECRMKDIINFFVSSSPVSTASDVT